MDINSTNSMERQLKKNKGNKKIYYSVHFSIKLINLIQTSENSLSYYLI